MPHEEVQPCHPKKHEQRVRASILGEADMVSHKGQGKCARNSNRPRKLLSEKIDHRDGEDSKDQRDNPKISFRFGERIELMGNHEKKGGLEISWIVFIKSDLALETIS
jgi:hypothetical protein